MKVDGIRKLPTSSSQLREYPTINLKWCITPCPFCCRSATVIDIENTLVNVCQRVCHEKKSVCKVPTVFMRSHDFCLISSMASIVPCTHDFGHMISVNVSPCVCRCDFSRDVHWVDVVASMPQRVCFIGSSLMLTVLGCRCPYLWMCIHLHTTAQCESLEHL